MAATGETPLYQSAAAVRTRRSFPSYIVMAGFMGHPTGLGGSRVSNEKRSHMPGSGQV